MEDEHLDPWLCPLLSSPQIPTKINSSLSLHVPQSLRKDAVSAVMSEWTFVSGSSALKTFHSLLDGVTLFLGQSCALSGIHTDFTTCHGGALSTLIFKELTEARDITHRTVCVATSLSCWLGTGDLLCCHVDFGFSAIFLTCVLEVIFPSD